jgi:hypothetical protein
LLHKLATDKARMHIKKQKYMQFVSSLDALCFCPAEFSQTARRAALSPNAKITRGAQRSRVYLLVALLPMDFQKARNEKVEKISSIEMRNRSRVSASTQLSVYARTVTLNSIFF